MWKQQPISLWLTLPNTRSPGVKNPTPCRRKSKSDSAKQINHPLNQRCASAQKHQMDLMCVHDMFSCCAVPYRLVGHPLCVLFANTDPSQPLLLCAVQVWRGCGAAGERLFRVVCGGDDAASGYDPTLLFLSVVGWGVRLVGHAYLRMPPSEKCSMCLHVHPPIVRGHGQAWSGWGKDTECPFHPMIFKQQRSSKGRRNPQQP